MSWIESLPLEQTSHSGSTLLSHMSETANLLQQWGAKESVIIAARYHAIYSTSTFNIELVSVSSRDKVKKSISEEAERLVYLFAFKDNRQFSRIVNCLIAEKEFDHTGEGEFVLTLRNEMGYEIISKETLQELSAICLANAIEQSSRLPCSHLDDKFWIKLANLSRPILPQLPSLPLSDFSKANEANEILELETALQWKEYKSKSNIVCVYDSIGKSAFHNIIKLIDLDSDGSVPLQYLIQKMDSLTLHTCILSPKITTRSIHTTFWDLKDSKKYIRDWLLRQMLAEGLVTNKFISSGTTANDLFYYSAINQNMEDLPSLYGSLPLDFHGEYDFLWTAGKNTEGTIHYDKTEANRCIERLNLAFEKINSIEPLTLDWIIDSTRVISLRKDNRDNSGSSSWPHTPGVIGLLNVANESVSLERIISAIIHESIHNLLYMVELELPFSADTNRFYNVICLSPWTGRQLPIASYLHACCVWFGLATFWKKAGWIIDGGINIAARKEYESACKGFDSDQYYQQLIANKKIIRKDLYSVLFRFPELIREKK